MSPRPVRDVIPIRDSIREGQKVRWTRNAVGLAGVVLKLISLPDGIPGIDVLCEVRTPGGVFYEYAANLEVIR